MDKFPLPDFNNMNPREVVEEQKQFAWRVKKEEIENLTDGLGMPIEAGILDTVIVFNLLQFPTRQSCEGHIEKRGYPFAWVDFKTPVDLNDEIGAEFYELEKGIAEWVAVGNKFNDFPHYTRWSEIQELFGERNKILMKEVEELLKKFYTEKSKSDFLLGVSFHGNYISRIKPQVAIDMEKKHRSSLRVGDSGGNPYENLTLEERKLFVEKSRQEMERLTEYLKEIYFKTN